MRYAVAIEKSDQGYGAYMPDLPGVISVGRLPRGSEGLRDCGDDIPEPKTLVAVIDDA